MRVVVTGIHGQVVTALVAAGRAAGSEVEVVPLGRPALDLERPEGVAEALRDAGPDVVVSAAAYTAVDQAEGDAERAHLVNGVGPGVLAGEAARLGAPIIHLSTDYVFDGTKPSPYVESDTPHPMTVYGSTKLEGERAVAAANPDHVILRTAWVYGADGKNFVRTMLRLAQTRERVGVVADQVGNPSYSADIAGGVLAVAARYRKGVGQAGVYHMAGGGETSWAGLAEAIFAGARKRGAPAAEIDPIATEAYPTPAARPRNSRLNCAKVLTAFEVALPDWRSGLDRCLDILCA